MYEIKQMSPEPEPKRQRQVSQNKNNNTLTDNTIFNELTSTNHYIYQHTLKPKQAPLSWRLIPIDLPLKKPTRRPEELPPVPCDPRLILQDLEEMKRQLLAELAEQDPTDSQDHPEDCLILDQI